MECFDDVLCEVKRLPNEGKNLIGVVVILCKLLAVNPAEVLAVKDLFQQHVT